MTTKDYPKGIYFNKKHEKAPSFVLGTIAIKTDSIDIEQLKRYTNEKGYAKIDIKEDRDGKPYGEFNTYGLTPVQEKKDDTEFLPF